MQALERVILSENFITIIFVFALALLAMLKSLNSKRLKGVVFAVFNTNFVEKEAEDNDSFFSAFNLILFVFSTITLPLVLYKLLFLFEFHSNSGFLFFLKIFVFVIGYFSLKWFFEFLIKALFFVKSETSFFSIAKSRYLYSISFGFLCLLLLTIYANLSPIFLLYGSILLLIIRFVAIVLNNKNLIISKLFYFILYLCALEIAPLFILFKLMF